MLERVCVLIIFLASVSVLEAQQTIDLVNQKNLRFVKSGSEYGSIAIKQDSILVVKTIDQPKFLYNLASGIPIHKRKLDKDRLLLLKFDARSISSLFETGEAKVHFVFRQSDSHKDNFMTTQSLKPEWETYYVPIRTKRAINAKDLRLTLQYGFRPQEFEMKNISLVYYPAGTSIDELPKTSITYSGMEEEAEWRQQANIRIEKFRKSDFSLTFTHGGKSLKNVPVHVEMVDHDFRWGAALQAEDVVQKNEIYDLFKTAFNTAVFENDLKIKRWKNEKFQNQTLNAIQILKEDSIEIKGHVLIWPGFKYMTPDFRKNRKNPERIWNMMEEHLRDIITKTSGNVTEWDVVNEAYTNRNLQEVTGSEEILYNGFSILNELDPKARKFINEYGIISKGGIDEQKQDWYREYAIRIDSATGGLLDGIGLQSHIGSHLTPPENVIKIIDSYSKIGKKVSISEFTMEMLDADIQYKYTKDFLIAAFSHPAVCEFLFWGYNGATHPKATIFDNGEMGPMGKAFFELIHGHWKTEFTIGTNEEGKLHARGFYGKYKYSFILDNKVITGHFFLKPGKNKSILIKT